MNKIKEYLQERGLVEPDGVVCSKTEPVVSKMEISHQERLERSLELVRRNLIAFNEVWVNCEDPEEKRELRKIIDWCKQSKEVIKEQLKKEIKKNGN